MKNLMKLLPFLMIGFLMTSCGEDDGPTPGVTGPTTGLNVAAFEIPANGVVDVTFTASQGDDEMTEFIIRKDGSTVLADDITIDGTQASFNGTPLTGALRSAIDFDIQINSGLAAGESATYTFEVVTTGTATGNESAFISVAAEMNPPIITTTSPVVYVTDANAFITQAIDVAKGTALIETLEAYENGVLIDTSRLAFGTQQWPSNPVGFDAVSAEGFTADLVFNAHNTDEQKRYMFVVVDEAGLRDSLIVDVTVETGTPVTTSTVTMFSNSAGPTGTGGVNLVTGASTGSSDGSAHLIDLGIDSNLPAETNWRQQITAGAATATLKRVINGTLFTDVDTREEIEALYNDVTSTDVGAESARLGGSELFVLVTTDGAYVLVRVDNVNVTEADNADSYDLSVKL